MDKLIAFTDPECGAYEGKTRILHVNFEAGSIWHRRGGKAVQLNDDYRAAVSNSSKLAGFVEGLRYTALTSLSTTTVAADRLAVNFGNDATCVFPTSNRLALENDVGHDRAVLVVGNRQFVDMNTTHPVALHIEKVLDDGHFVSCSIALAARDGEI